MTRIFITKAIQALSRLSALVVYACHYSSTQLSLSSTDEHTNLMTRWFPKFSSIGGTIPFQAICIISALRAITFFLLIQWMFRVTLHNRRPEQTNK
jgi:hypothetical protein